MHAFTRLQHVNNFILCRHSSFGQGCSWQCWMMEWILTVQHWQRSTKSVIYKTTAYHAYMAGGCHIDLQGWDTYMGRTHFCSLTPPWVSRIRYLIKLPVRPCWLPYSKNSKIYEKQQFHIFSVFLIFFFLTLRNNSLNAISTCYNPPTFDDIILSKEVYTLQRPTNISWHITREMFNSQIHVVFHQSHPGVPWPAFFVVVTYDVFVVRVRMLRKVSLD